jgi:F plasmid transfer operon protein TraF
MRRTKIAAALLCLSLPVAANAASFQPLGKTGMGGAGVAVTTDSFASYWNPAGLAFYDKPFSAKFNGGVGININSALSENTDKLGKLDFNNLNDLNVSSNPNANAIKAAGEAVQFIGILKDIDNRGGTLTVNPGAALAFQYRNYGLGAFVSSEIDVYVNKVDTVNILPANNNTSLATFATDIGAAAGRPANAVFSTAQYNSIVSAFSGNNAVVDTLERELAESNKAGLPAEQLAQALIDLGGSFNGTNTSIDNNTTSLAVRGLLLAEVPIAYGYKFDLKEFGQLGVGGAVKVMMGTVYGSIINIQEAKGSNNIVNKITDSRTDSTAVGLDLGVAWRKEFPLVGQFNAGLVAKNLNSPEFDNPTGFSKTKVEPQVRMGVALDPFTWLTVAADMDMTKNKTLAPGNESQNFGFGAELRPFSFFALRGGMYTNMAESSAGPVGTFGLSLGPNWLKLDLDVASAFKTTTFDNKSFPREAKIEFGLSTMF